MTNTGDEGAGDDLAQLRRFVVETLRTGNHSDVATLNHRSDLLLRAQDCPGLALDLVRLFLWQGQVRRAADVLEASRKTACGPRDSALRELASARIAIAGRAAFGEALSQVEMIAKDFAIRDLAALEADEVAVEVAAVTALAAVFGFHGTPPPHDLATWRITALRLIAGGLPGKGCHALVDAAMCEADLDARINELSAASIMSEGCGEVVTAGVARVRLARAIRLRRPDDFRRFHDEFSRANALFLSSSCLAGVNDVNSARGELIDSRTSFRMRQLNRLLKSFEDLGHAAGAATVLSEMSHWMALRGDVAGSRQTLLRLGELAASSGQALVRRQGVVASIDWHRQRAESEAGLALSVESDSDKSALLESAATEQLLARVFLSKRQWNSAFDHMRMAIENFAFAGEQGAASTAVLNFARDLVDLGGTQHLDDAEALVRRWIILDQCLNLPQHAAAKADLLSQFAQMRRDL